MRRDALLAGVVLLISLFLVPVTSSATSYTRNLTIGSTGADVSALQAFLIASGEPIASGATGYFGNETQSALAAFQSVHDITPSSGYFGPVTRAFLLGTPSPSVANPVNANSFTRDLTLGDQGSDVTALQTFLINLGDVIAAGATGYFGEETQSALAAFQAAHGISPAVGYFGSLTRSAVQAVLGSSSAQLSVTSVGASTGTSTTTQPTSSSATLAAPSNFSSSFSTNSVTLMWQPVSGATSYTVERAVGGSSTYTPIISNLTTTSYIDTGVSSGNSYSYEVVAVNTTGQSPASAVVSGMIPILGAAGDTTPPVISSIVSTTSSATSTVTWTTDEAATSKVVYGLTTTYGSASSTATFVTSHSIGLSGLATSTTYHFAVVSTDGSGNTATSTDQTFTTSSGACPFGSADQDGCGGSPGGTIQHANLEAYAAQSGETWFSAHPMTWNVPGVDYAVGAYTATSSMADPDTLTSGPCQYSSSVSHNGFTGPAVVCQSSSATVTISGVDFSQHSCTPIIVRTNFTGTLNINDNYWANGSNCATTNIQATSPGYFIQVSNLGSANLNVTSNTFEGLWNSFPYEMEGALWDATTGTLTFEYNSIHDYPGRPIVFANGSANGVFRYNIVDGYENKPWQGHSEVDVFSPAANSTTASIDMSFNTIIQPSTSGTVGTAPIYTSNGLSNGVTFTNWTSNNNVIISNTAGGGSAVTGTVSGTVDNGSGTGPGDIFTITSMSGGITAASAGMDFNHSGKGLWLDSNVGGGTGVGSQWIVTCQSYNQSGSDCAPTATGSITGTTVTFTTNPGTLQAGQTITGTGVTSGTTITGSITQWNGTSASATVSSSQTVGSETLTVGSGINPFIQITVSNASFNAFSMSQSFTETSNDTFGQITLDQNYIDGTGSDGFAIANAGAVCDSPTIFSGDIDLVSGNAISGYSSTTGGC